MSNLVRQSYPLRLPPEIRERVENSAKNKNWSLSTWYREAVVLMLSIEDARGGKL